MLSFHSLQFGLLDPTGPDRGFCLDCAAAALAGLRDRAVLQDSLTFYQDQADPADLARALQQLAGTHLELVLNTLEARFSHQLHRKTTLLSRLKEKFNEEKKARVLVDLLNCLTAALKATISPSITLFSFVALCMQQQTNTDIMCLCSVYTRCLYNCV